MKHSLKEKHIDINYYYIQDIVEIGEIKVNYISYEEMVADPMTNELTLHVRTMSLRCI